MGQDRKLVVKNREQLPAAKSMGKSLVKKILFVASILLQYM
jgi:hypothetical protein